MKIRTDYVSNSSSSSFIIANSKVLEQFKIGKKQLIDTLKALMPEDEHKNFRVYDMHNKQDVKALEKIHGCLDGFSCTEAYLDPDTGRLTSGNYGYEKWRDFRNAFFNIYDISNYDDWMNDDDYHQTIWKYDKEGKCIDTKDVKPPKWMINVIKHVRKDSGVLTNWEAAHRPEARYVVHFADNVINTIHGFEEPGMHEDLQTPYFGRKTLNKYQKELNKKIRESTWETENYSLDRLCEILMRYWIDNGIIDHNDDIFKKIMGEEAFKDTRRYPALYYDMISFCGHEG